MLSDELPQTTIVFSRINTGLHDELAEHTARFLRDGGKIKKYSSGATSDFQTINAKSEAVKRGGQNGANTGKLTAKLKAIEIKT